MQKKKIADDIHTEWKWQSALLDKVSYCLHCGNTLDWSDENAMDKRER